MLLDYGLIALVGLLGSFGHCVGMCGPITVALALGQVRDKQSDFQAQWQFHLWLNVGRILSYALVGGAIGTIASVVVASGQLAGVGSELRRGLTLFSGVLLIWFGLVQINPQILPKIPLLNPMASGALHDRLKVAMNQLALQRSPLTPLLLGLVWGLIPCGFLYAAQLTAAQTANLWQGSLTMVAFGLGTLPTMLGMGLITAHLGRDRRSQLFRVAGWLTLLIGGLILFRTGDTMTDYGGHGALICLMLALVARPLSRLWSGLLRYRRLLGVGAFVLSSIHILQMLQHNWDWQWIAVQFLVPSQQLGIVCGVIALTLMTPAALTSFDAAQRFLGSQWRRLHLLTVPALIFAAGHTVLVGSHYWGNLVRAWPHHLWSGLLMILVLAVLGVRSPWIWSCFSVEQYYASTFSPATPRPSESCCSVEDTRSRPSGETRL